MCLGSGMNYTKCLCLHEHLLHRGSFSSGYHRQRKGTSILLSKPDIFDYENNNKLHTMTTQNLHYILD